MAHKKDYYAILGISRNASPEEIRQAYFDAARRLHPDKNVAPGETELFIEVQEAYETLANPKKTRQIRCYPASRTAGADPHRNADSLQPAESPAAARIAIGLRLARTGSPT